MSRMNQLAGTCLPICLLILLFIIPGVAQQAPAWEFYGGYSIRRSDVREYYKTTPTIYTFRDQYSNLNGFDVSATENINRWFGGTVDFSSHYKTPTLLAIANQERTYSLLYGPKFSYRTTWLTPFAHVLLGVAHYAIAVTPVGPSASDLSFAAALGGGLDVNLRRAPGKLSIRVIQAEFFETQTLGAMRNDFRASSGVVFGLGKKK